MTADRTDPPGPRGADRSAGRERRRAITGARRTDAERRVCARVLSSAWYRDARTIALYRAADGEVDPSGIGTAARAAGRTTVYPVVEEDTLVFRAWDGEASLVTGRYGVDEPVGPAIVDVESIDLVVVPLVRFDAARHRIGMGQGFYDRTFALRHHTPGPPWLVGLAFDEQELDAVDPTVHDVRLDAVATPTRWVVDG